MCRGPLWSHDQLIFMNLKVRNVKERIDYGGKKPHNSAKAKRQTLKQFIQFRMNSWTCSVLISWKRGRPSVGARRAVPLAVVASLIVSAPTESGPPALHFELPRVLLAEPQSLAPRDQGGHCFPCSLTGPRSCHSRYAHLGSWAPTLLEMDPVPHPSLGGCVPPTPAPPSKHSHPQTAPSSLTSEHPVSYQKGAFLPPLSP